MHAVNSSPGENGASHECEQLNGRGESLFIFMPSPLSLSAGPIDGQSARWLEWMHDEFYR